MFLVFRLNVYLVSPTPQVSTRQSEQARTERIGFSLVFYILAAMLRDGYAEESRRRTVISFPSSADTYYIMSYNHISGDSLSSTQNTSERSGLFHFLIRLTISGNWTA